MFWKGFFECFFFLLISLMTCEGSGVWVESEWIMRERRRKSW